MCPPDEPYRTRGRKGGPDAVAGVSEEPVELHKAGENFQRFIKAVSEYADGPTRRFTGTTVEDPAAS